MIGRIARLAGASALVGVLAASAVLIPVGGAWQSFEGLLDTAPAVDQSNRTLPVASTLLDSRGRPFARIYDKQYRLTATTEQTGDAIRKAVVAVEDRRFYEHRGVDWYGVGRAMLDNAVSSGDPLSGQGASTITMQYVKNHRLYAVADTEEQQDAAVADNVGRKLLDVQLALTVEQRTAKEEILTRYLNAVYFGNKAYGIRTAANTYFGVEPEALTVPQAALLAGMIKSPTAFDPVKKPREAQVRRSVVLALMRESGMITPAEQDAANAAPLGIRIPLARTGSGCAAAEPATGLFCAYTLDYLASTGVPLTKLQTGGYIVRTSLDLDTSRVADQAATRQVPVPAVKGIANAIAIVAPGADRHPVVALAANRDFGPNAAAGQTSYPIASAPAPHGAGSVYKIFTAAAALRQGVNLNTELDVPEKYTSRVFRNAGEPYTVKNAGDYQGEMSLQQALASSPNTAFVALEDHIGSITPIVDMAWALGMRESLKVPDSQGGTVGEAVRSDQRASFTLGPVPASPLELANVAATLMSKGRWCPPTPITAVEDSRGAPVALTEEPCAEAVSPGLADALVDGLSTDTTGGTATKPAGAAGWQRPMLGKTGTTQDSKSSAFVGATPQLAGAVITWSDGVQPRPVCVNPPRLCGSGNLFGATIPAATWFATMSPLHRSLPVIPLPKAGPEYTDGGKVEAKGSGDDEDDEDDEDDGDDDDDEGDEDEGDEDDDED